MFYKLNKETMDPDASYLLISGFLQKTRISPEILRFSPGRKRVFHLYFILAEGPGVARGHIFLA